jgi:hypothetical protein
MGSYPLKVTGTRQGRSLWLAGAAALALALWLALRPEPEVWQEFVPWCGSRHKPIYIAGEPRERFLLLMSDVFDSVGMEHTIKNGRLFVRDTASFDGMVSWSVLEVGMNFPWKVVSDIADGVTIDDVHFPPPPALVEAIRATEPRFGPFPRRNEKGERIYGPDLRFKDCELMRAAILKQP